MSNGTSNQVWYLTSNGTVSGTASLISCAPGYSLAGIGDFNGDGNKDLLISGGGTQVVALLNSSLAYIGDKSGSFTPDAIQSLAGANEGNDTVISSISYVLPSGVENLTLASGAGNINATGNGLDNTIIGNEGNNVLTGGGGVDTLTGGAGADTFVFADGDTGATSGHRDAITDFAPGTDKIDLQRYRCRYYGRRARMPSTSWALLLSTGRRARCIRRTMRPTTSRSWKGIPTAIRPPISASSSVAISR